MTALKCTSCGRAAMAIGGKLACLSPYCEGATQSTLDVLAGENTTVAITNASPGHRTSHIDSSDTSRDHHHARGEYEASAGEKHTRPNANDAERTSHSDETAQPQRDGACLTSTQEARESGFAHANERHGLAGEAGS